MSSTSTSWTTQGNTKAGATSSSTDSLTTGTLTANTIQLASNIIKASDGGSTITLDTSDNVTIAGGLTIGGTANLDAVDIDGNVQLDGTFTVGVDGTGKDVKFFGDDPGNFMLWDQSADRLEIRNDYARAGLLLSNTDAGASNSPAIDYYRNSASAAASDTLGVTTYKGRNGANDADVIYARLQSSIIDATKGGEEGAFKIGVMANGTFQQDAFTLSGQSDGTIDVAIGSGAASVTSIRGDLTITGGNITNAITCDSTVTTTGLLTATSGVKLGNNIIYASDGGETITLDTSDNVTILGDLTVTGGDVDLSGEASQITVIDNTSSAFQIGSTGNLDLFHISTLNTQETVSIDGDRSHTTVAAGALVCKGTAAVSGSYVGSSNLGGLKFEGPGYINTSGSNTLAWHNYIFVSDVDITNTSGSTSITNVAFLELENNLGTTNSCTTSSDKTGEAKSGTIKINVNGTLYHIQLYAD